MRNSAHTHLGRITFLMPIILIAIVTACHALPMEVTVGFDGVFKLSYWAPVAVKLTNPSEENVEGLLLIDCPNGGKAPMPMCSTKVNLPAHSTKLYHAYIRPSSFGGEFTVILAGRKGILASKDCRANVGDDDDKLIVAVGDRSSRLGFMNGEKIAVPAQFSSSHGSSTSPTEATINAGFLSPQMLPDRPAAYEGIDVLVLFDLSMDSTNPNALKAICMWVASGGTLVVPTGPDCRAFANAFYNELLPVKIQSAANIPDMAPLGALGKSPFPPGVAAVAKSTLKPGIGHALVSADGMPIVAERSYGAGRVVFLAFDPRLSPFRGWDGEIEFWKNLVKGASQQPFAPTDRRFGNEEQYGPVSNQDEAASAFVQLARQHPSIKIPTTNTIGLFLLTYLVCLVPVNYYVLRRRRRLELAWVTTPAIVLLFTIGAYGLGYTMKGGMLRLCEATLVEGSSNARYARMISSASIFSPARRSYNLTISDPYSISQTLATARNDKPVGAFLGETSTIENLAIPMWSSKTVQSVGGVDIGGVIDAQLKVSNGEIIGKITNNTGVNLKDCVLSSGNMSTKLQSLKAGQTREIRLSVGKAFAQSSNISYSSIPSAPLNSRVSAYVSSRAPQYSQPLLVGFADTRKGVIDIPEHHPVAERSTCYVFHLDCSVAALAKRASP